MKAIEITNRVSRFFVPALVKKIIILVLTCAIAVFATLACFYFQLAQKDGLCTLIMLADWVLVLVAYLIAKIPVKKENYQRLVCTAYAMMCETKGFKNKKELLAKILPITEKTIEGTAGYAQAKRENNELLNSMLANEQAFPHVKPSFFSRLRYKSFSDFAILSCICSGANSNRKHSLVTSSCWYKVHKQLMQPIGVTKITIYLVAWLISSLAIIITLCNLFDLNNQAQLIILFSLLAIIMQVKNLSTCQNYLSKIASVLTSGEVPKPDIRICLAFANTSEYYRNRCIETGVIQSTETSREVLQ